MMAATPPTGTAPSVDILMATYNGEAYLSEQVASLQAQTHASWRLLASDDGSTDGTVGLLQRLASEDLRIEVVEDAESHRGACQRFLWLLGRAEADYVLFCDQDDVWDPEKVERLLAAATDLEERHGKDAPVLASCDAEVTDSDLATIAPSFMAYEHYDPHESRLPRLLVCNTAPGCTMLLNRALVDVLAAPGQSSDIAMHDWWAMLAASAFGHLAYVDVPLVKYRQHQSNVTGVQGFGIARYLTRLGAVLEAHVRSQRQAGAFAQAYASTLAPADLKVCEAFASMGRGGVRSVATLARYGLWEPGFARRVGQVVVRLLYRVLE